MRHLVNVALAATLLVMVGPAGRAAAWEPNCKGVIKCHCEHCQRPWNGPYYNTTWGTPVALVVPPTAELQTKWGWGVANTRVTPICAQYKRNWRGVITYDRSLFAPTPAWPSDTDQFGTYYVRGPW